MINFSILSVFLLLTSAFSANTSLYAQSRFSAESDTISAQRVRVPDMTRLQEISDMSIYKYDTPAESPGLWQRFRNWLQQLVSGWVDNIWVQRILKAVGALALVVVLLLLINQISRGELRNAFVRSSDNTIKAAAEWTENKSGKPMRQLAREAVENGELSLATHYLYQHILELLSSSGLIRWMPHKTNEEYVAELRGNVIHEGFQRLTRIFEYVDYGEFEIDKDTFQKVENLSAELERQIPESNYA